MCASQKKKFDFIKTFKNKGGKKLIYHFFKSGVFFSVLLQFILLGKSKIALELLSLVVSFKIHKKLSKSYYEELCNFDKNYKESNRTKISKYSNVIWICWLQGEDNAPAMVKACINSIRTNITDRQIILLNNNNVNSFVTFPDYIQHKVNKRIISRTHFSDLLRLELLTRYGGTWIDATVLCTTNNIPSFYFDSDLFFFQTLKPGKNGLSTYMSSWFITSKPNNKILEATKYLCYLYWKKNKYQIDYFLLHHFMSMVLDFYEDDWKKVIPKDNSTPHILLLRLFDKYDETLWANIVVQTPFHKLSYKFSDSQSKIVRNTFYEKVLNLYEELVNK